MMEPIAGIHEPQVPEGRRPLTSKYVFKLKTLYDPATNEYYHKYKARLVAQGFQQEEGVEGMVLTL